MNDLNYLHIALIYLAIINVVTFSMYGIDKWKAKKSKWRIRETTLLGLAVLGGSIGAWLEMKVWHHKTQHKKFKYNLPAIIIVQLALIVYFMHIFIYNHFMMMPSLFQLSGICLSIYPMSLTIRHIHPQEQQ